MPECAAASDCPGSTVPRCEASCVDGECGIACDTAPPAAGPECPAGGDEQCAAACAFFAACAIEQCDPLAEDSYIPLYEGCVQDQCGQAGLICTQTMCAVLIGLAQTVDATFRDVCENGPPQE